MSAAPDIINAQNVAEIAQCWKGAPLVRKDSGKGPSPARLISGEASSSGDEFNTKVRKPYTITKQRERWTESEHQKFLEALKLYGRAWRRIEEYIGTKTAVQIRSHAQKFFSKLEREASTGSSAGKTQDIEIPPPRPKRKPSHPYPKKAGNNALNLEDENKEFSSLSSAGLATVHHEGFQSGSFNPYVSKGLGSAFHASPLVPGHFFGPKGMKLFGKTVVVPKSHKPASQNNASKECKVGEEIPSPNVQTNKSDLKQFAGFSPFLKVRKNVEKVSEAPLPSDINGSEGTGTSLARTCRDDVSPGTDEPEAADVQFLGKGKEQQRRSRVDASLGKIENTSALSQKEGEKVDVQFPHGVHQNNLMHHWIDNYVRYHTGLSIPPMAAHGLADGVPADPLTYWQCMQASAVNYAAYTAAMAAAAAAGWTGSIAGGREPAEAFQANSSEAQVLSSFDKALPSATSSWWPFRGFMPSGHCPPPRGGEDMDVAANANPLGYANKNGTSEETSLPGETATDLEMVDEEETSEQFSNVDIEDDGKKHTEFSPSTKSGCMLGTSCVTEAPGSDSALPDSESQHEVDAAIMLVKCPTQESDIERRADIEPPQNLYSSSDEFEGQGKKPGEGSSSGSNTPASRFQSTEFDAPTMLQSKKRDSYTLFEDHDDTYSDAFKTSHQQCVVNTVDSPKIRLKHAEKARKNQQKDSRHSDDSKRLKSCVHELELRKEVSQEGRKAFQALFTSKLLPQSFPAANMAEDSNVSYRNEHISRPAVSKNEPGSINVPVPIERASDECVNTGGSPQGKINGEVHLCGNKLSATGANLEMGIGYGVLDSQHEVDSKSFTVSLSSGFVPYRRPLCLEPMNS